MIGKHGLNQTCIKELLEHFVNSKAVVVFIWHKARFHANMIGPYAYLGITGVIPWGGGITKKIPELPAVVVFIWHKARFHASMIGPYAK